MPLYDYACGEHGQFEAFARMADCSTPQPCPECGAESPRIIVAFSPRDYLDTLVVYQRPDKTYGVLGQKDGRIPEGCIRVEAKETWHKRAIEHEIDREHREQWERAQIGKQMQTEIATRENRSELRNIMNGGAIVELPDRTNLDKLEKRFVKLSPAQRDFARYAMEQNNQKPREKYTGAFFFEALERNASNREDGRNRDGSKVRK
jgi:putative FmdB family regulatory protein